MSAPAPTRPTMQNNAYDVYCGIDFGTHGTAYAFCTPDDPNPRAQQNWGGEITAYKTRTDILLNPQRECIGAKGFGDNAYRTYTNMKDAAEQKRHYFFRKFKMALHRSSAANDRKEADIEEELYTQDGRKVSSETILVEALKFIVSHVMNQINDVYGIDDPGRVQWVVTVPSIWTQRSRKIMKKAAHDAGIPNTRHNQVIIALEPECAAITVAQTEHFNVGESWMLVDCGGGTVDIACQELDEHCEIKEIYHSTGGAWGSTYIDEAWLEFLHVVFGEEVHTEIQEAVRGDDPSLIEDLIRSFNMSKENATPEEPDRNVNIVELRDILSDIFGSVDDVNDHLATVEFRGATGLKYNRRGKLNLSRAIWWELFNTVIAPIVEHIQSLLDIESLDKIQTICVVGGFAESPFLIDALQREFSPRRRVFVPTRPILAVVRGAALSGLLPGFITERRARKTVGISVEARFNPETDPPERARYCPVYGQKAVGVFRKFVQCNQTLPFTMKPICQPFASTHDTTLVRIYQLDGEHGVPRFIPDGLQPSGVLVLKFPDGFDVRKDKIVVSFDFSGQLVKVKAQCNDGQQREIEIDWA